jgi:hypothetical protein
MTTRSEVVELLNLFKGCVALERFHVRDREKNRQGLIDLNMNVVDRRESLLSLVPEDYVAGPKPDDTDDTKEVWEFGKDVAGTEVYIKLRVVEDSRHKNTFHATVWSFHPAEYSLRYPMRGGGG